MVGLPVPDIPVRTEGLVGYTVPQRVSGQEPVSLFFRPRRPVENCTVSLIRDGAILSKKRFARLLPAQMEHISLPALPAEGGEVKVVTDHD